MRAIEVTSAGSPDVLTPVEYDAPRPSPTEVVVDVKFAGINFIDTYQRSGVYPMNMPYIPGAEGSGIVREVGDDVDSLSIGDRVAWAHAPGSYAEQLALPANRALRVPDNLDLDTAAALPLQGMTAHYLVDGAAVVSEGTTVMLTGGAGGVGLLTTQLAAARGARVLSLVGSADKAQLARDADAAEIIFYREMDDIATELPRAVRDLTDGHGADVVLDGVGQDTFDGSLASLRKRGLLVLFGGASGQVPLFDLQRLNTAGSVYVTRPTLADYIVDEAEEEWRWTSVSAPAAAGELSVHIGQVFDLNDARLAHEAIESGRTSGKILLRL